MQQTRIAVKTEDVDLGNVSAAGQESCSLFLEAAQLT
jgi:hypothetical protein